MAQIPLFPLRSVLFPGGPLPLRIFETRYADLVRRCMREQSGFGVLLIVEGQEVAAGPADPPLLTVNVGTLAHIVDFSQLADGLLGIACRGGQRFRLIARERQSDGLNLGEVEWFEEQAHVPLPARHLALAQLLRRVLPQLGGLYESVEKHFDDAAWVGYRLAEILPLAPEDKQMLLEIVDPVALLDRLSPFIERETH